MTAHLDAAHRFARWLVHDATLAEDIVHDAVLRALGHAATFKGGNARAWLMRIVRHTAYDALARRPAAALHLSVADGDAQALAVADPGDDPEAAMMRRQDGADLARRLEALPADQRACLVLREFEGLSYQEIGEIVGVPIGTVMSRLWRARQALLRGGPDGGETGRAMR